VPTPLEPVRNPRAQRDPALIGLFVVVGLVVLAAVVLALGWLF